MLADLIFNFTKKLNTYFAKLHSYCHNFMTQIPVRYEIPFVYEIPFLY